MKNVQLLIVAVLILLLINSCNRKTSPGGSSSRSVYSTDSNRLVTSTSGKPAPTKKIKTTVPKVIVVNDNVASKTFDGRYYYDLDGHRYWRNNKDGKYYLYNKSMNTDPDFKKL